MFPILGHYSKIDKQMNKDRSFGWVWSLVMTVGFIVMFFVWITGKSKKNSNDTETTSLVDKYVLVDENGTLHQCSCMALRYPEDGLHYVQFIEVGELHRNDFAWFCPSCISARDYEQIMKLFK